MEKAERCQGCGTAPWEWDEERGGSRFAYEAQPRTCPGCAQRAMMKDDPNLPNGATIVLTPRAVAMRMRRLEAKVRRRAKRRAAAREVAQ